MFQMVIKHQVLLFKSPPDKTGSDAYQQHLDSLGFKTEIVPVIDFIFVNQDLLLEKISSPDDYSSIVFTSKRAVESVKRIIDNDHTDFLRKWKDKKVFVVGQGTGQIVKNELGLENCIGEEAGNAENLANCILTISELDKSKKILFPKGNLAREALTQTLTFSDYNVDEVITYTTISNPNLESIIEQLLVPEFVVFFSPSGVSASWSFISKYFDAEFEKIKIVAIGPTTASEIDKQGYNKSRVVKKPNPVILGETLLQSE